MKIGLIEHKYHATSLAMFLQVLDQNGIEVSLFTSLLLFKEIELFFGKNKIPIKDVFLKKQASDIIFMNYIKHHSTHLEKLIFLELQFQSDEEWGFFLNNDWRCPIWYVIHHVINETGNRFVWPWRINKFRTNLNYRKSLQKAERIIVHGLKMKEDLENILNNKRISFLPFCFSNTLFERKIPDALPDKVRICVAGNITDQRRDYFSLLDAFKKASDSAAKLSLILAGRPIGKYGEKVVEACQAFNEKRETNKIVWFDGYVPEDLYITELKRSDFLIAPLSEPSSLLVKMFKKGGYNREYNIRTKQTGATFDSIRFKLPVAYPSFFLKSEDVHDGCVVFNDYHELTDLMISISLDSGFLQELTKKAISYSKGFEKEHFQKQILKTLLSKYGIINSES